MQLGGIATDEPPGHRFPCVSSLGALRPVATGQVGGDGRTNQILQGRRINVVPLAMTRTISSGAHRGNRVRLTWCSGPLLNAHREAVV